jgi:hypothetical protein
MVNPIEAGDPRRALASNKFYQDLNNLNHRLDVLSKIPFDVPIIIIQQWQVQNFKAHTSTMLVQVSSMDAEYLYCMLYAGDNTFVFFHDVANVILSLSGVIQWRLLDSSFLGTTINWPVKTDEYINLFDMEI